MPPSCSLSLSELFKLQMQNRSDRLEQQFWMEMHLQTETSFINCLSILWIIMLSIQRPDTSVNLIYSLRLKVYTDNINDLHVTSSQLVDGGLNLVELSQDFLLTWNYCYTGVEKEMALMKGKSFGKPRVVCCACKSTLYSHSSLYLYFV